jgi:UDP-N-acetylglucosamine acyltransferase
LIDPRAIVDPKAELAADVEVGPFAIVGPDVEIGPGSAVGAHAVVRGPTRMGRGNRIFPFASVGDEPQDKKYHGEGSWLEMGDGNTVREYCTINRGTEAGGGVTRIGDDNWIMAYVHIAHDCRVGSHTIFANAASLAGHVDVGDHSVLGGFTLVSQFCRLGEHSFTAMGSVIPRDVPPYVLVSGHMAQPYGVNTEGLKRRGFSEEALRGVRQAYKLLYRSKLGLEDAVARIRELAEDVPEVRIVAEFLETSERGIVR